MYIVREDGLVIWITIKVGPKPTMNMNVAGDLDCHVGTAFASLGDEGGPDILAIAGETSTGRIVGIGHFPTTRVIEEMTREEAMNFNVIEFIPNWSSITDVISATQLHANRHQSAHTDSVLVTCGRQPYGVVTEIRRGLEGRISAAISLGILSGIVDIWAVPDRSMGSIVVVLSSPLTTRLLRIDGDCEDLVDIDDSTAFDLTKPTLMAGITSSGQLVQVTSHGFCVTGSIRGNFEDTIRKHSDSSATILAAVLLGDENILITVDSDDSECNICCYTLSSVDNEPGINLRASTRLGCNAICVAAVKGDDGILAFAATVDGTIDVMFSNGTDHTSVVHTAELPKSSAASDASSVCDSIAILQAKPDQELSDALLLVCGLRDGRIVTFVTDWTSRRGLIQTNVIAFRDSTIRLVPLSSDRSAAYALSGASVCLISWDGSTTNIENIWLSDKAEPERAQPAVIACAQAPQAMWLSSSTMAESLIVASEDELIFADVQSVPTTVPRQIPVDGTPNRIIHAESLRSIVCSTLFSGVRTFPSSRPHCAPEVRRQMWPIIHFIPSSKGSEGSYKHHMQPGDRVNAMLEWSYTSRESNKSYSYILVGGRHMRRNGQARGRVTFLQFSLRHWKVENVTERYCLDFTDEVYSMARVDDNTIAICTGELVIHYTYREESKEWQRIQVSNSKEGVRLGSQAVFATVDSSNGGSNIVISTPRDSLVVLDGTSGETIAMGPKAQQLLSHHLIKQPDGASRRLVLVSAKYAELTGLSWAIDDRLNQPAQVESIGLLHCSIIRFVNSSPPARKGSPPMGIRPERVIGCATDGSLIGIVLVDLNLWRRLSWLQRLIEWSPELSPHAQDNPLYEPSGNTSGIPRRERGLPIGLSSQSHDLVPLQAKIDKENDMHIDGDILGRVLEKRGVEEVKSMMGKMAVEAENAVGRWMAQHLDEEMAALEEVVGIVKELQRWM